MAKENNARRAAPAARSAARRPAAKATRAAPARKKAVSASKYEDVKPIREALTRVGLIEHVSEAAEVDRKTAKLAVQAVMEAIVGSVKPRGAGKFVMPGLFRVITVHKPATKARKGINPFTKEPTVFKARPARTVVKIRPGKELKAAALGE